VPADAAAAPSLGPTSPPLVVVLSGPSGVGKDAVIQRMIELGYPVLMPVTMTTRPPRDAEVDGIHYRFVDDDAFDRALADGELLEHAEVYGRRYGVPRSGVRHALESGNHVLIRVDVQGAASLRETLPDALTIFLVPDDPAHLERHLRERGSEDDTALRLRLDTAARELAEAPHFDHVIENVEGDLDATVEALAAVIRAEAKREGRGPPRV
jgi:guanylate kinase